MKSNELNLVASRLLVLPESLGIHAESVTPIPQARADIYSPGAGDGYCSLLLCGSLLLMSVIYARPASAL